MWLRSFIFRNPSQPDSTQMEHRVRELEERIARLEARLATVPAPVASASPPSADAGATLVVPVRIVDADGRLLGSVDHDQRDVSFRLFNPASGSVAAAAGVNGTGGYVTVYDGSPAESRTGGLPSRKRREKLLRKMKKKERKQQEP